MRYLPLTNNERQEILKLCGVSNFKDLIQAIPEELQLKGLLDLPPALSEPEIMDELESLASQNTATSMQSHLGQGVYDHTWPSVIDQLSNRGEFLTAYTPYQPEVSQGTLQAIFEFQSVISEILGMEISNASLYDGATSVLEAVLMAARTRPQNNPVVYVSEGCYPNTRKILETCLSDQGIEVRTWKADPHSLLSTPESFQNSENIKPVAFVLQSPNKWGLIEDWSAVNKLSKSHDARSIAYVSHILSMGTYQSPGHADVDIAVAEGQPLGIPVGFGGPHLGLFTCKRADIRQMPGRLVGVTEDSRGERAFCVTLSTREQHIRREKATSNICSNQNLMALRALMYTTLMGPNGFKEIARHCRSSAYYVRSALQKKFIESNRELKVVDGEIFNEITIFAGHKDALWIDEKIAAAQEIGILIGLEIEVPKNSNYVKGLNIAFTERHRKEHLIKLIEILGA